jgi:hypothetical protein
MIGRRIVAYPMDVPGSISRPAGCFVAKRTNWNGHTDPLCVLSQILPERDVR